MTRHTDAILEKTKSSKYTELNSDFAIKLTNESERGAILIGVSKVEVYLESLILKVLPSQEKSYTNKLLNYPGALSSFSGKIELSFAFGILDKATYESLNTLRKIRNDAAHSKEEFSLQKNKKNLEIIYSFEYGFPEIVHRLSFDHLIAWKKDIIKKGLADKNLLDKFNVEDLWNKHIPDPETNESIQEQLTIWKLAYGLTLLCLKLEVITDEYKQAT